MNTQPVIKDGYYLHYKNKLYRLLDFGKHANTSEEMVIYQPQYNSEEFGNHIFWVKSKDLFFTDTEFAGKEVPRFKYVANTISEVSAELEKNKINISPIYKPHGLQKIKSDFSIQKDIILLGLAKHSDTLENHFIFSKDKQPSILILPEQNFLEMYKIN